MHPIEAALYARVSTDQQTRGQTIVSQVAALRERVAVDGLVLDPEHVFVDDGVSGTSLLRPALERLRDGVVLLPTAPALAMRTLARLDQPFTTSQARQALDTTRRIAVPLLEHLDSRGWTQRLDAGHRNVVR